MPLGLEVEGSTVLLTYPMCHLCGKDTWWTKRTPLVNDWHPVMDFCWYLVTNSVCYTYLGSTSLAFSADNPIRGCRASLSSTGACRSRWIAMFPMAMSPNIRWVESESQRKDNRLATQQSAVQLWRVRHSIKWCEPRPQPHHNHTTTTLWCMVTKETTMVTTRKLGEVTAWRTGPILQNIKKLFKYLLFSKILSHGQLGRFSHLAAALWREFCF